MKVTQTLFRLAFHAERIFDSAAHVLRLQRKIPECLPLSSPSNTANLISFSTNDYLSFATYLQAHSISKERVLCSRQPAYGIVDKSVTSLERDIARFHSRSESIVTASADHAIWAVFNALVTPDDAVLIDVFSRPIISLAARASRAKVVETYNHCDMADLEHKLKDNAHCRLRFVVTDGFFELGSNVPPLIELGNLVSLYEPSLLVLNDAGNMGVLGNLGTGLENHFNVEDLADVLLGGFEHAFGLPHCGFVTSSSTSVITCVRNAAIAYSRTPAVCPDIASQASAALQYFESSCKEILDDLRQKVKYVRSSLEQIGFNVIGNVPAHPAINVLLHHPKTDDGTNKLCRNLYDTANSARLVHKRLLSRGIEIGCPLPPIVPFNGGRLRIDVSHRHTYDQLDCLLQALEESALGLKGVLKRSRSLVK